MAPPPTRKRRSVLDFSRSQTGDVATGDVAGGNIENRHGFSGDEVQRLLETQKEFSLSMVSAFERVWTRIDQMERERRKGERDAAMERGIDFESRLKRQAALDAYHLELDRQLGINRRWLAALTVGFVAAFVVLALLAYDRYVFVSVARAWFDVALAVVSARAR